MVYAMRERSEFSRRVRPRSKMLGAMPRRKFGNQRVHMSGGRNAQLRVTVASVSKRNARIQRSDDQEIVVARPGASDRLEFVDPPRVFLASRHLQSGQQYPSASGTGRSTRMTSQRNDASASCRKLLGP